MRGMKIQQKCRCIYMKIEFDELPNDERVQCHVQSSCTNCVDVIPIQKVLTKMIVH